MYICYKLFSFVDLLSDGVSLGSALGAIEGALLGIELGALRVWKCLKLVNVICVQFEKAKQELLSSLYTYSLTETR